MSTSVRVSVSTPGELTSSPYQIPPPTGARLRWNAPVFTTSDVAASGSTATTPCTLASFELITHPLSVTDPPS